MSPFFAQPLHAMQQQQQQQSKTAEAEDPKKAIEVKNEEAEGAEPAEDAEEEAEGLEPAGDAEGLVEGEVEALSDELVLGDGLGVALDVELGVVGLDAVLLGEGKIVKEGVAEDVGLGVALGDGEVVGEGVRGAPPGVGDALRS